MQNEQETTFEHTLIRSRRRTISIEITEDEKVTVRAPMRAPDSEIKRFVKANEDWIRTHLAKIKKKNDLAQDYAPISDNELNALYDLALARIPDRVRYYAEILGVTYGKISVRKQKTLWGSCTGEGNLSFNCLIMKAPERVRDYVIVHELCHRKQMNHSRAFWKCVESVIPDHESCRKWLSNEGDILMRSYRD